MYKIIIEVLSSLTPIVIGAAVVYIAWQQHQTNKNRLNMQLFDRRYKIYDAVIAVITKDLDDFDDNTAMCLHREVSATRFLFNSDKEVLDFQVKVAHAVLAIGTFMTEYRDCGDDEEMDEKQRQELSDLHKDLLELRQEATDIFSKYLTLEA